jgi:hypothetical protein
MRCITRRHPTSIQFVERLSLFIHPIPVLSPLCLRFLLLLPLKTLSRQPCLTKRDPTALPRLTTATITTYLRPLRLLNLYIMTSIPIIMRIPSQTTRLTLPMIPHLSTSARWALPLSTDIQYLKLSCWALSASYVPCALVELLPNPESSISESDLCLFSACFFINTGPV